MIADILFFISFSPQIGLSTANFAPFGQHFSGRHLIADILAATVFFVFEHFQKKNAEKNTIIYEKQLSMDCLIKYA